MPQQDNGWPGSPETASSKGAKEANGQHRREVGVNAACGSFSRADRLGRPADFKRVQRRGQRRVSPEFIVIAADAAESKGAGQKRLGLTVSRRVGCAVRRNRIKRHVREWFRATRKELRLGTELVVIARPGASRLSGREIAVLLTQLMRAAAGVQSGE